MSAGQSHRLSWLLYFISGLGMFRCFVVVYVTMACQCALLFYLVGHSDISIRFIMAGTMMSIGQSLAQGYRALCLVLYVLHERIASFQISC